MDNWKVLWLESDEDEEEETAKEQPLSPKEQFIDRMRNMLKDSDPKGMRQIQCYVNHHVPDEAKLPEVKDRVCNWLFKIGSSGTGTAVNNLELQRDEDSCTCDTCDPLPSEHLSPDRLDLTLAYELEKRPWAWQYPEADISEFCPCVSPTAVSTENYPRQITRN